MAPAAFDKPVQDTVPKVDKEVAVGEDLDFQRSWWKFERIIWTVLVLIIACDLAGLFGRGPLAHAHIQNTTLDLKYDRIARYGTPSMVNVSFDPSTMTNGKYNLFVSESLIGQLGTDRVIPAPQSTKIGGNGLTYTFPAIPGGPAVAQFSLQPSRPGLFHFTVQVPGAAPLHASVFVMP